MNKAVHEEEKSFTGISCDQDRSFMISDWSIESSKQEGKITQLEKPSPTIKLSKFEKTHYLEEIPLDKVQNIARGEKMKSIGDISKIQEELQDSNQGIIFKRGTIQELEFQCGQYEVSHSHLMENIISMEGLISVLKEELQVKSDNLEELALKFEHELRRREILEEHNLELQKLVQETHSSANESIKKMHEAQVLLEMSEFQVHELEENLIIVERKLMNALLENDQYKSTLSKFSSKVEALNVKSCSLEMALNAANETQKDLVDMLARVNEEKRLIEDIANEAYILIENLKFQLNSKEKYQNFEKSYANDPLAMVGEGKIQLTKNVIEAGNLMEKSKSHDEWVIFNQDHENATRELLTIKEVLMDEGSKPHNLCQENRIVKETSEEALERSSKIRYNAKSKTQKLNNLQNQLEGYTEALEIENLKLIVYLTTFETQLNDLQRALNIFMAQEREIGEYPRRTPASEGQKFQPQILSIVEEHNLHQHKELREESYPMEENNKFVQTDMESQIRDLEKQLFLSKKEVGCLRAFLAEKEAEMSYIMEEKNGVMEELFQLKKELNIACQTVFEKSRGEINKWHSKDFPQASTAASNFSFESSQNDRKILEEDTEKPTTDRNLNFILVTILISIILAIILGMRF